MSNSATPNFADWLVMQRALARLTRQALAERAGISRNTLRDIESGKRVPHARTVKKLERALALDVRVGPPTPRQPYQ